jgi:hypothetical protein
VLKRVPRVQIPLSPPVKKIEKPGPAQRGGYESRQVRKEAAVIANPCAAASLAPFYKIVMSD